MKKILALILAVATLCTVFVLTGCNGNNETPNTEVQAQNSNQFVVENGDSSGISLMKTVLSPEDYENYGVAMAAESAYTINATVEPADAVNKTVNWSMAWTNPNSTWTSGKNVADYVTLSNTTGSSVTVSCLQPFGSQITVKAVSAADANIFATCTLDYAQKVTNATLNFGNIPMNLGGQTAIKYEVAPTVTGMGGKVTANVATSEVYSLADNFIQSVTLHPIAVDGTGVFFECKDLTISNMAYDVNTNYIGQDIYYDYLHDINGWAIFQRQGDILFKNLSTAQICDYLNNITQPILYEVTFTLKGTYNTYTYTTQVVCNGYTNNTPVSALNLSSSGYVF